MEGGAMRFRSIATLSLCLIIVSACDNAPTTDQDSGTEPGEDAGTPGPNPFFPQHLADAATALENALGEQPLAGDVKVAVIANRISNFWTPAQIGTATASQRIGCVSQFAASINGTVE